MLHGGGLLKSHAIKGFVFVLVIGTQSKSRIVLLHSIILYTKTVNEKTSFFVIACVQTLVSSFTLTA